MNLTRHLPVSTCDTTIELSGEFELYGEFDMSDEKIQNEENETTRHDGKQSGDKESEKKSEKRKSDPWVLWTRDIAICLILVLLFRANVAEANYIPSPSMEPTLMVSDRIIVDKISLKWRPLERGELVVFHPPLEDRRGERWIKRVIGIPGDTVEVVRGVVYINGEKTDEPYIENPGRYSRELIKLAEDDPSTPENEGEYYFMGDNRDNSRDSHIWGPCPAGNVIGRAVFRYWPVGSMGLIDDKE